MAASAFAAAQIQPMETMHIKMPQQHTQLSSSLANVDLKRSKFKLEPIKVLEPSSRKLVIPEAQRVMYILEGLVRKVEIVDYIILIANNEEKMGNLIRSNLTDDDRKNKLDEVFIHMCKYHKELIDRYSSGDFKTVEQMNTEEYFDSNRSVIGQTKESLEALIKNSIKDILRVFHTKPSLYESLKSEFAKVKSSNAQINDILGLLNEIRDIIHERLLVTPGEQKQKIEYIKELLLKEKTNNELIKKLREEVNAATANKDKEIQSRNDQIRKLDNDLKHVERFGSDLVKRTKVEAEQQETSELKASDGRKAKLQQELNQLKQQFQLLVLEHREQEQLLRKEKWKHETTVETLLNRYDNEMGTKQDELDEISTLYEEEKKQLGELEEKFKPLEEEYLKIMDERKLIDFNKRLEEENLQRKIKAAVTIQSFWRAFKVRRGLFKKKGKRKGKGKGKRGKAAK